MIDHKYPLNTQLYILRKEINVFQKMLNQREDHDEAGMVRDWLNDLAKFTGLASDMISTDFTNYTFDGKEINSEITRVISNLFVYKVMAKKMGRDDEFCNMIEEWRMTLVNARDEFNAFIRKANEMREKD